MTGGARSGEDAVALDVRALQDWMVHQGVPVAGSLTARRVGLGQSNLTYELTDDGAGRWVARRPPLGHLLASAHDVAREHKILAALAGTDVPAPGVVGLVSDDAVCDVPVLVIDFVEGLVVDRMAVAEGLGQDQRHRIGLELARVLATLHRVDVEAVGLHDLARHSPYAERQLKRWTRQWQASRTRDQPALDRLTAWLHDHVPAATSLRVVHGDLHIRNVIVDPASAHIRAALDWELCTLGEPLADLGTTLAYWPRPDRPAAGLFGASQLPGFASQDEVAAAYADESGRSLDGLTFWHVLGMWKIAIIAEGVRRRALDEPANAAEGGPPSSEVIDELVDQAWAVART